MTLLLRHYILVGISLLFSFFGHSTIETYSQRAYLEGSNLPIGATVGVAIPNPPANSFNQEVSLAIEDGRFLEHAGSPNFIDISKRLRLKLGIEERVGDSYQGLAAFNYLVEFTIQPIGTNNMPVGSPFTVNLEVEYIAGSAEAIKLSNYIHEDFYKYQVTAKSISNNSNVNIYVEAELEIDRYINLSMTAPTIKPKLVKITSSGDELISDIVTPVSSTNDNNGQEIELVWNYIEGAEEYELEWTWIDDYDMPNMTTGSPQYKDAVDVSLTTREFELNNTRVITNEQQYRIPLIYKRGFIVYRVRAVGRWTDDASHIKHRKFGSWSAGANYSKVSNWPDYISIETSHESEKNWQFQAVYAEEGKKKEIVSYFDGSLRNRQTVTKINSNNEAIVGESIYDNQGRAAVQILPTPVGNPALKYYPQLNKVVELDDITGQEKQANELKPFSHVNFDWDNFNNDQCAVIQPATMSAATGASKYYSSNNAVTDNWQDNTPLANGYPYTQIEYTADNTGRIKTQTGVGEDYVLNSGQETRYFYGQPAQIELNRLFGFMVGNKAHYKKNMVVDANGQVSVSYLDPQGRVIATSLAGDNDEQPDGTSDTHLKSLPSELTAAGQLTEDLLGKVAADDVDTDVDDNIKESSGFNGGSIDALKMSTVKHSVLESNSINFAYSAEILEFEPCPGESYPLAYVIDLSASNECGDEVEIHTETFNTNTVTTGVYSYSWGNDFNIESYDVSKMLRVDPIKLEEYAIHYLENSNCVTPIIYPTNASCDEDPPAGGGDTGGGDGGGDPGSGTSTCNPADWQEIDMTSCAIAKIMMLQDLSPDGQYGATDGTDLTSVFSQQNVLEFGFEGGDDFYNENNVPLKSSNLNRFNPITPVSYTGSNPFTLPGNIPEQLYINNDGTVATIDVVWNGVDAFEPALIPINQIGEDLEINNNPLAQGLEVVDAAQNLYRANVAYIADVNVFVANWQSNWAESLLPHHPEYDYLVYQQQFCQTSSPITNPSTEQYDATILQIDTYDEAANYPGETCNNLFTSNLLTGNNIRTQDPLDGTTLQTTSTEGDLTFVENYLDHILNTDYKGSGQTLLDYAIATVFCGSDFSNSCAFNSLADLTDNNPLNGELTPEELDQVWNIYKVLYISEKKKAIQVFIDFESISNGYYNGYIGDDPEKVPGYNGFYPYQDFLLTNGITLGGNVLSIVGEAITERQDLIDVNGNGNPLEDAFNQYSTNGEFYDLFHGKVKRFAPIDNLYDGAIPEIDAIEQQVVETGSAYYEETGLCPLSVELEMFLNAMAQSGELNTGNMVNTNTIPEFSLGLFNAVGGVIPATYSTLNTATEVYGTGVNLLTLQLNDATNTTNTIAIIDGSNLPSGTTFANVVGFNTLAGSSTSAGGSFSVLAVLDVSSVMQEVVLTGTTSIDFMGCATDYYNNLGKEDCERVNNFGNDLYQLILGIVDANNTLSATVGNKIGVNYFGSELAILMNDQATVLNNTSSYTSSSVSTLPTSITISNNSRELKLETNSTISLSSINSYVGYEINENMTVLTIYYVDNNGSQFSVDYVVSFKNNNMTAFVNISCPCEEVLVFNEKFESFLNALVSAAHNHPTISDFTSIVSEELNDISSYVSAPNPNGILVVNNVTINEQLTESISFQFGCYNHLECCEVEISQEETSNATILSIQNLEVTFSLYGDYLMTAVALYSDGTIQNLTADLPKSCITIPTCGPPCIPDPPLPVSCTEKYADYVTLLTDPSTGLGADIADILTEEEFCNYQLAPVMDYYSHYIAQQNLDITSIDSDYYITISQFAASLLGNGNGFDPTVSNNTFYSTINDYATNATLQTSWNEYVEGLSLDVCLPPMQVNLDLTVEFPCELYTANVDIVNTNVAYEIYLENLKEEFKADYIERALSSVVENFSATYADKEYHYTLYYYDQAGNLVQTVPPSGVERHSFTAYTAPDNIAINEERQLKTTDPISNVNYNTNSSLIPDHSYKTQYQYNSLNQLVWQKTPDGGESTFAYDDLGRLVLSQNAVQIANSEASYTVYDPLGRISQVGELNFAVAYAFVEGQLYNPSDLTEPIPLQDHIDDNYQLQIFPKYLEIEDSRMEVTITQYDYLPNNSQIFASDYAANNTRNRITAVYYYNNYPTSVNSVLEHQSATYYDYDVHGNVKQLIQEIDDDEIAAIDANQTKKHMSYSYDLVSGNVKEVAYQQGQPDQFIHRYCYDADNRITIAETSKDKVNWEKDAKYFYYNHGPLARVEIGEDKVQSLDYAYTIQGWLKGVNSENLLSSTDQGKDGYSGTVHTEINQMNAKDVTGYSLHYFNGDYQGRQGVGFLANSYDPVSKLPHNSLGSNDLFNGNIKEMFTASTDPNENYMGTNHTWYRYDQLNRIRSMNQEELAVNETPALAQEMYAATYDYDANGNLDILKRYSDNGSGTSVLIDDFKYHYNTGNNQLNWVEDYTGTTSVLSDGTDLAGQASNNYDYDAIGQLIEDVAEGIDEIVWTVTGKVKSIDKTGTDDDIEFEYDAMGNRIKKIIKKSNGDIDKKYIYIRDAQGNVMSVYKLQINDDNGNVQNEDNLYLSERNIYGSSRVGMEQVGQIIASSNTGNITINEENGIYSSIMGKYVQTVGDKSYELSNHLGNVLQVITDRKLAEDDGNGDIAYYTPDVVSQSDYYPFGMMLPNRNETQGDGYRYGFQGQEMDDEVKNSPGTSINYKYRMHDPRVGRFFTIDPLTAGYPHNSPYAFSENRVIDGVELEGLEYATVVYKYHGNNKPVFEVIWHNDNQHNEYGDMGKGVAFRSERYDDEGGLISTSKTSFYSRSGTFNHGFYYGPKQLPDLWVVKNYKLEAVDAVDEAGRIHDHAYDLVGATANNAKKSWATIEADEAFIKANKIVAERYIKGESDPFNSQKITQAEYGAAIDGVSYFELSQWNKIEAVSNWMEKNYSSVSKKGSGFWNDNEMNQRSNYNKFRDIYMHQDPKGNWLRNTGMWKVVGNGDPSDPNSDSYWAPKTKEELKSE